MSQTITVPGYPASNRVPGVFATVDASKANSATVVQRSILLAQMLTSGGNMGTATPGVPVISAGVGDAITSYGLGSQAAEAVERYRNLDLTGELWVMPLQDAAGSVKAVMTATFSAIAPATAALAAATLPLYVDSYYIPVSVNLGDTPTVIAAEAATAVNSWTTPNGNKTNWLATAAGGVLTLTARNAGTMGNQGTLGLSLRGTAGGQGPVGSTNVPGISAVLAMVDSGTTDPNIANALANLPVTPFDFIYCPYNDPTSLAAVQQFLGDAAGRWNWSVQLFGGAFTAYGGTLSQRGNWSAMNNNQHLAAIGADGSPSPDRFWALDFMAASAVSIRADPTIPIGGLTAGVALNVMAPPLIDQDGFAEREALLFEGMSTYKVDPAGVVHVDRAITTYQFNAAGGADNAYLSLNVPFQLMAYIRVLETMLGSNFNQVKLVADGSRIPPGSGMVTSQTILFAIVAQYGQIATVGIPGAPAGLVQNPKAFAAGAVATNAGGGVVTCLLPVELGNQLIAIAMSIQFTTP